VDGVFFGIQGLLGKMQAQGSAKQSVPQGHREGVFGTTPGDFLPTYLVHEFLVVNGDHGPGWKSKIGRMTTNDPVNSKIDFLADLEVLVVIRGFDEVNDLQIQ
jgi:hypothetical protein